MQGARALCIGLAAAVMLAGCASPARWKAPRSSAPASAPASPLVVSDASAPPAAAEPPPAVGRLAIVQSAAPARLEFRDETLGDLRTPRSALGERATKGAAYGATPGVMLVGMSMGNPGAVLVGGAAAIVGVAVGAVTGTIVGGVEDAVNRSSIPSEKINLYTPRLRAAGSDLVLGPLALRDCVAEQLGPARAAAQVNIADAAEAPDFLLLAQQGFSHVLTLDEIELAFVREAGGDAREDRQERFAVTVVSRYRVHELGDSPRVVHTGSARHGSSALRLDRWAAEQAREVHELAARGCPLLAEQIGADLSARFSLAGN